MRFIIRLKHKTTEKIIETLKENGLKIESILNVRPIIITETNSEHINFGNMDFIDYVKEDEEFSLQDILPIPKLRFNKVKARNYKGAGVNVAIIDSGINVSEIEVHHSEICSLSLTPNDALINGGPHGTFVAKIIKDIAPWCRLYNLKVSSDKGIILESSILKALDFAYTNGIKLINISLGIIRDCTPQCMVCDMVNNMVESGFTIVTVIGNYGRNGPGITVCPGNAEKAFTVGAINQSSKLAEFSSTAKPGTNKPNILAPGYFRIDGVDIQGTSFAAPFITGIIAALSEQFSFETIIESIKSTATNLGLQRYEQGSGLVHIENLLGVLQNEKSVNQG